MHPLTRPPRFFGSFAGSAVFMAVSASAMLALAGCGSVGSGATGLSPALSPVLSSARIAEVVASPDRSDADRSNDLRRKPEQMLAFIGIRPGMLALDISAGGGYTTELLARAVGPAGRVYGQSAPRIARPPPAQPEGAAAPSPSPSIAAALVPAGAAPRPVPTGLVARAQKPGLGHIVVVVQPFENPLPPEVPAHTLDLATLMFNYHDLGHMGVDRAQLNRAVFAALKPGGVYVIADHSGRPGTGISEAGTLHRIEESFLRAEVESAGFRWRASGDFLRNPADPRDQNTPNPPQPKDEFVLKFVKP
jgi:predicted methyltransferase